MKSQPNSHYSGANPELKFREPKPNWSYRWDQWRVHCPLRYHQNSCTEDTQCLTWQTPWQADGRPCDSELLLHERTSQSPSQDRREAYNLRSSHGVYPVDSSSLRPTCSKKKIPYSFCCSCLHRKPHKDKLMKLLGWNCLEKY